MGEGFRKFECANSARMRDETELYKMTNPSSKMFVQFGPGISMYFFSLRVMSIILFVVGIISIQIIIIFLLE